MTGLRRAGRLVYGIYIGIGIFAMGLMAFGVIFSVVMRYWFNISYIFLEEAITFVFTFTTFWGVGACLLENEHIVIDFFINRLGFRNRRILNIFNYALVLLVNATLIYYSLTWIRKTGRVVSNAMRIQYKYLYSAMPVGLAIGVLCAAIKIVLLLTEQDEAQRASVERMGDLS